MTDSTASTGHLHRGDRTEEVETLRRLLTNLDGDTGDEYADRRRRLSDAIRGVLAKHAY